MVVVSGTHGQPHVRPRSLCDIAAWGVRLVGAYPRCVQVERQSPLPLRLALRPLAR
jgi:hypothetical protein